MTLSATDALSGVASTYYSLNGGAATTYTAPVALTTDGTTTVKYWSVDRAGNTETSKTATALIDMTAPTTPVKVSANAVATTSVEVTWTPSTDALSGLTRYNVYCNGSLVGTSTSTTYTATGLTAGQTYTLAVCAVDAAGNQSARTSAAALTLPASAIWMTITTPGPGQGLDLGAIDPGTGSATPSGTTVAVGGVGATHYTLSVSGQNFTDQTTASVPPTMPVSVMSYATRGWAVTGPAPFSTSDSPVANSTGTTYVWQQNYIFDYSINIGWQYAPGSYTTNVVYTIVPD